jgi:hypothetical protein
VKKVDVNLLLTIIIAILIPATLALMTLSNEIIRYVDISRQMLDLSIQQREDNAAVMARVWEIIDADPAEPPATMSQTDALDVLREGIRREAERKSAGE